MSTRASRNAWFDRPFDRLTVLSRVEGLTVLSAVEGLTVLSRVEGLTVLSEVEGQFVPKAQAMNPNTTTFLK